MKNLVITLCLLLAVSSTGHAVIIYGVDNAGNQSDPGIGNIWNAVVEVAQPTQAHNASAVYLGNGYFITAKHVDAIVGTDVKQVNVNGVTYTLDAAFGDKGVQLVENLPGVTGSVDMKLFKLSNAPALPAVRLNTSTSDTGQAAYLVGCGWGKGSEIINQGWNWDVNQTAKRWGQTVTNLSATEANLYTDFSTAYGTNAATLTMGDSGSGLFEFQDGAWSLSGLSVDVRTLYASYYNLGNTDPANPDWSSYVRISTYATAINNVIPEPASILLLALGLPLLLFRRRALLVLAGVVALFSAYQAKAQLVTNIGDSAALFVSQCNANRISQVASDGSVTVFVTTGLSSPYDLAFDTQGNMYTVNYFGNSVSKITAAGVISTYATGLTGPAGLAFDNAGVLYVSNLNNDTISKVYQDGTVEYFTTTLGPTSLAFDASGNLFVANLTKATNGTQVSKITSDGTVSLFADNVPSPNGLAFGKDGNLYVSNLHEHSITMLTPDGIASIYASGSLLGGSAQMAFDSVGNLFVANFDINTIAKVTSDGTISKFADVAGGPAGIAFAIPEPATIGLLLLGGCAFLYGKRRIKGRAAECLKFNGLVC